MQELSKLETEFLDACRKGDIDAVKAALDAGVNPNVTDREWTTGILLAAQGEHLELVRFLTTVPGLDVNAQNQKCFNPFIHGCINNNLELVKIMAEAGCELERLTRFGGNGLTPAAEKGHVEIVEYLVKHTDINLNHTNTLGWTALIEAVILNDGGETPQAVVKLLLENGADPRMVNEYGVAPVDLAKEKGYTELAEIIQSFM